MDSGDPFRHWISAFEVLRDYPLAPLRGDSAVPDAFRLDQHPRSAAADAEAGRLGPQRRQTQFMQARFQDFPRGQSVVGGAAIRSDAEENVTPRRLEPH